MTPDGAGNGEALESGLDIQILRRRREAVVTIAALLVLLGTMSVAAYYFLHPRRADLRQIVAVAEKRVETAVGPGYRYAFPLFQEMKVTAQGNDEYLVTGWGEAISRDGHVEPIFFQCRVVPGRGKEWVPATLELKR